MKPIKDIDLKVSVGLSLLGILATCYLWTFVNQGSHWELFGTKIEEFLKGYGRGLIALFSGILLLPIFLKRDRKRIALSGISIPVFIFLCYSLTIFLD